MESTGIVLSTIGTVIGFLGLLIAWVGLKPEARAELKRILKSIGGHSAKLTAALAAVFTSSMNGWEIYLFGVAETAPTRADILILLLTLWNTIAYFFCAMWIFVVWLKEVLNKNYPVQAQT